jgi:hypothetical protein
MHERARFWFPGLPYWVGRGNGYSNWSDHEPSRPLGDELLCGRASPTDGRWSSELCDAPAPAICRVRANSP